MTEPIQAMIPLTEIPVSGHEQAKADILESYLFSSIAHDPKTLTATLHTTMNVGEEKINAMALLQILQRFHLESVKISALIIHGLLAEEPFEKSLFIPWDGNGLGRTISLVSHTNDVTLSISGTLPQDGQNGSLLHTYYAQSSDAGEILSSGRIDFRELHRYPPVSHGAPLLRISMSRPEKNGLSYEGATLLASQAKEYPVQLGKNVEKVYYTTDDGCPGYDIKSLREGVVTTRFDNGNIAFIDVTNLIVLGEIDFSVGNIGSDAVCPVSMQAESVNEGFTVNVAGSVSVRTIAGGSVEAGKKADVDQMLPGSELTSGGDITCRSVSASVLTAKESTVFIQREAIDATIHAHRLEMNTTASLLLNSHIHACTVDLSNVRISGANHVTLAPGLFAARETLIEERQSLTTEHVETEETLNQAKAGLVEELKKLSAEFGEDNAVRPVFKHIVEALKAYNFDKIPPLMAALKRGNTCLAINEALRTIEHIKEQLQRCIGCRSALKDASAQIEAIESKLSAISFSIQARIRPSARIEIHLGAKDMAPLTLAAPPGKDQDHAIRIRGAYDPDKGLVIIERSG